MLRRRSKKKLLTISVVGALVFIVFMATTYAGFHWIPWVWCWFRYFGC